MPNKKEFLKSLDVVGEAFPIIKEIVKEGFYTLNCERESDFVQISLIIKLYSILKKGKELKGRNLDALTFYLREGYSKKIKEKMARQLNIQENNINQVNSNLRKLGYLIVDSNNHVKNTIDPELVKLKEYIVDREKNSIHIKWN